MMVSNRGSVLRLLAWQWHYALFFIAAGLAAPAARHFAGLEIRMPLAPLTVLGGTLGIFVSFRTNSAYGRWWEARQLWGRMVNASRLFASQVLAYLPSDPSGGPTPLQRELVMRHVAYVHALRVLLRLEELTKDEDVARTIGKDRRLIGQSNLTHALVHEQLAALTAEADAGRLDGLRLTSFDQTVAELLGVQGGCERIKRTPLPRGYGFIAQRLVLCFAILFPFAVVDDLGVWTAPTNLIVCLGFHLVGEVGRVLEDPFTQFWNGLPLSQLSKMIEVNLRERLGDTELPAIPTVDARGLLM